jgi:hypothetical protein
MTRQPRRSRLLPPLLLLLILGGVSGCRRDRDDGAPEPGTDLYAVAPETIREVTFSSPDHKLYAYRWAAGDTFHVVIATRGTAAAEQCAAGEGFARWLSTVARMPITRELDGRVDSAAAEWADLRLRDATQLEPIDVRLGVPIAAGGPTVIQYGDKQYEVEMDSTALRSVRAGCPALGVKR